MRRAKRFVLPTVICVAELSLATFVNPGMAADNPAPAAPQKTKIAEAVAAYVRLFNEHNADAISAHWKEDALYVANATGERIAGRKALAEKYRALFKDDPKCELAVHITVVRTLAPTVISLDGVADVRHTDGDQTRSEFSATLVLEAGQWLIDRVHETDVPLLPGATAGLSQLDWLIGDWTDKTADGVVENEIHWSTNLNFIVRSYRQEKKDAASRDGTQVIGWDPEQHCIRAWLFDGSGGFGEGLWQREGENKWVNKMVIKLPDGRRGSFTQVLQRDGDDKLSIQTIDRQIDGEPQPNSPPVSLVRATNAAANNEDGKQ